MSSSKIPKATPRTSKTMYVPGSSPEAQNANLRVVVDELRSHVSQLKKDLEAEKCHLKELKREKLSEVKSVRDHEQQKASQSLSELRSKLGHEKQREVVALRESLNKQHDQEINRLLKQRQELLARTQGEAQRERETHYLKVKQQVWAEAKEEVKRTFEMDKGKLLAEMDELRRGKRKLEEELNDAVAGDRQRAADLRRQWGEHQREMEQLQRDARRDIQRLMEELKSKDRVISELEKELGHKTGYSQRLQTEKDSLSSLLSLSKMAESWDQRSAVTGQDAPAVSRPASMSSSTVVNDEEEKAWHRKIADLNTSLRKLEDRNKQLIEDKADLERKIRTSSEARNTTPLIEKNKRLLRKIKDLEGGKKKLDERNKALAEENQKLRSLKENMRCRLERENQSLRKVLSKERQQTQRGGTSSSTGQEAATEDREEELRKLRVEVQEQFLEIVELKQAALEQERLSKATPEHGHSRLPVPTSRPRSASLTPYNLEEEADMRSRSGSWDTSTLSPLVLSDCEDGFEEFAWQDFSEDQLSARQQGEMTDGKPPAPVPRIKKLRHQNKELEEKCSRLEWSLQDSKDQNELLEFRILELEEQDLVTPVPSPSQESDEENKLRDFKSLEVRLREGESLVQSLQQEVQSQRECVRQMEDAHEQRVSELERTEARLHSRIKDLEDQLAQLQEDIHLGLAERNREQTDLEAEIASLRGSCQDLTEERDVALERLGHLEVGQESWREEEERFQRKLKKKEQAETNLKRQVEKLTVELSALHEQITLPHESSNTNESNNKATMENSQEVSALQQKVLQLEVVKESLEAKLKDIEELVLNSDFSSEESLREKIAELEQANKLLTRQLKQSQASDVDSREVVEKAVADARDTEKALRDRIQELQQSEQSLLDRVAQLEDRDSVLRSQVGSLQDRVQDVEELRQQLKGKLEKAEERIEELQVAEKFARDELSASHGASSFLGESLGLMGELASLTEEEYVVVEEEDMLELLTEAQEPNIPKLQEEKDNDEPEKEYRLAQLEKSETELMEKVQVLEQANVELDDMCQELKSRVLECAQENETLKEKLEELEELQTQIPEFVRVLEEAEEEKTTLKELVKELESEVEHLKREGGNKDSDQNDFGSMEDERELEKELEVVKEENLELSDKLADEHRKLQELRRANGQLTEQLQLQTFDDPNLSQTTESHKVINELRQEILKSKSEKAQFEEQMQTECKELKSVIDTLQASNEELEERLESSGNELTRLDELSSELHAELEHRIENLEREKEELEKHLEEALEQKSDPYSDSPESDKFLQEQIQLEKENQDLLQKLESLEEECNKLQERIGSREQELQEQKSELNVARKDSMRTSLEWGDSTRELADVKKRLGELEDVESQFFDQAEVLSKLEKEIEDLKRQMEDDEGNKRKLSTLNDQLDAQNQELRELRETITNLEEAKENLQDKLDVEAELLEETSDKLEVTQSELDKAKEELNCRREEVETAEERVHDFEGQWSKLEELENENKRLQSIVNASVVNGEDGGVENFESLKQRVTELTEQEEELKLQIGELQERQLAYEETIAQADLIVSETHQQLSDQNELLQANEQELQNVRDQLESSKEEDVSQKLQVLDDTTHELERKNKQLEVGEEKLKELVASVKAYEEKCQLQEEKLKGLQQDELMLVSRLESLQEPSQSESHDEVESVVQASTGATQESASALGSSSDAAVLAEKIQVMKQNEQVLQQRIEHFQERQAAFEETLAQADVMITESNRKLDDKNGLCEVQENELLELRKNIAHLRSVACTDNLEEKLQLLAETPQELNMKNEELNKLRDELEMLTQNLEFTTAKCRQLEEKLLGLEQSERTNESATLEEESVTSLRKKLADMTNNEEIMQQRISELEERQGAFEETLAQADVIMTERESGFLEQISELKSSHSDLQEKLQRVSESEQLGLQRRSSDEDDVGGSEVFSIFSQDVASDALEVERNNARLQEEVAKLKDAEQELLEDIENCKTIEKALRSSGDDLQQQLNLARDRIKELESALEERGPDNDMQAQLAELKAGVQLHERTNLRLKEEIENLKETICALQEQLLQSPNQQISEDGFIKPGALTVEHELIKPQIVVSEEASVPNEIDLKETVRRLEQEVHEAKNQLRDAETARDSSNAKAAERDATVERLEKANRALQDDVDITMTQLEDLEQQLSQISQANTNVDSSQGSQSRSEQIVQELQDTIQDLQNKLEIAEKANVKFPKHDESTARSKPHEEQEPDKTKHREIQELQKSVEWFQQEMVSANSERVKTTNRLTEIVQFNREIKQDLRELEDFEEILKTDNTRLKQEKDLLMVKLSTLGICEEDLQKELVIATEDKQDETTKRKVCYQPVLHISKGCQTGPLSYIPDECLLATILIEEFEMTLKEFLEALPHSHSPTDPVLLQEGKHFFVEFNKLFHGKCRTPRARLLRGLGKKLPSVKPQPERVKRKPTYPSMPGEECFKEQRGSEEEKPRPLEAASPTSKKLMIDEFVAALWDLPLETPPDVDWDSAILWCPDDEAAMEEDSIDAADGTQVNKEPGAECGKELSVELQTLPPALPESAPRRRTGSMSSDSLSGEPPCLPEDSPPRRVIRIDSLEVEDNEEADDSDEGEGDLSASPPPLPASSPPRKSNSSLQSPNQPGGIIGGFRSPSFESRSQTDDREPPPPLPKTSPPGKPNASTVPRKRDQWRSSLNALYSESEPSHSDIDQNQQAVGSIDPDSDASSTDTLTDHETYRREVPDNKEPGRKWNHLDGASRATSTHRPASFDSGLETVSSVTEQEVDAVTAASAFAGTDHFLGLPPGPGTREGAGTFLAKPATPMWLKQMMDWQTAEKEKEETDLGRLRMSVDTMEKQLQEKEEVVKELQQSEESLKKKLRDYGDLRPLKLQLQTKEIHLQDRERQVALLKSEVKQREREVTGLQTKLEDMKLRQQDINQTDEMNKAAEMSRLKQKLEQSQESLRAQERELKSKEDEEARHQEELEKKEKALSSKEEVLEKQSEELRNLEAALKEHQLKPVTSTDHADAGRSRDSSSPDMSPDSRPGETKSNDSRSQELRLASALDALTRENEELRRRVHRLGTMEERLGGLQEQLTDSRHSNRDHGALQRKLHMAEEMLREKTTEELQLAEDNTALEDRVRHLEEEKRERDGIEEDYILIKEQFDDMEHKKNEAEISVAPLKAKVSYLLQKCKDRDAVIQRFVAELEQVRPDRTDHLLTEVSDLSAAALPDERFVEPVPADGRAGRAKRRIGEASSHERRRNGGDTRRQRGSRFSKSLNDVRMDDPSDDDELGRLSATRARSGLDPPGRSLEELGSGGAGISLRELMRRTSGIRSRSHLAPSKEVEDQDGDLLGSVLDASPARSKAAPRLAGDTRFPSSGRRRGISPMRNDLSPGIHDARRDDGLLHLSNGAGPSRTRPHVFTQSPLFSSRHQEPKRRPFPVVGSDGDIDDYIPHPEDDGSSPSAPYPGTNVHPSVWPSGQTVNCTSSATASSSPAVNPQSAPLAGHQTLDVTQGQPRASKSVTRSGDAKSVNGISPTSSTAVAHTGSVLGVRNGSIPHSNSTAPGTGTVRGISGQHAGATGTGTWPVREAVSTGTREVVSALREGHQTRRAVDATGFNAGRLQTGSGIFAAHTDENTAATAVGSPTAHPGIPAQSGRAVSGAVGDTALPRESLAAEVSLTPNGHCSNVAQAGMVSHTPTVRTLGLDEIGSSRQGVYSPATYHTSSTVVAPLATEEIPTLPAPSLQQINTVSGPAQPHVPASVPRVQPGPGSPSVGGRLVPETALGFPTFSDQHAHGRSGTVQPAQSGVGTSVAPRHLVSKASLARPTSDAQQLSGGRAASQLGANVPNVQPGMGSPIASSRHLVSETPIAYPTFEAQQINAGSGTSQPGANLPNAQPELGSPSSPLVSQTSTGLPALGAQQVHESVASHLGEFPSILQPGLGSPDPHPVSKSPLVRQSESTNQTRTLRGQPEFGSSNQHAGFKGHDNASNVGRLSSAPQQHVIGASAVHRGTPPSGSLSQTSATDSHQQGTPYFHTNQQQSPNRIAPRVASDSQNGHMTLSPSSLYPMSANHVSPSVTMPGNGHITPTAPVAGTQLLSNNFSSRPLITSTGGQPTHRAASSNGTPSHRHNLPRGVDVPDQSGAKHYGSRMQANGRGTKTPHVQGTPQPPRSLTVSKVIGRHGAVVTWRPPDLDDLGQSNGSEVVGYKIFVDGRQKQFVTNAHLTKALVEGVNLRSVQTFGIQTISATGQTSPLVSTHFEDPGHLSSSWSESAMTASTLGHGAVPSDGSSVVSEESQERLFMAVYNYKPVEHSPNHYPTYELAFEEGDIVTVYGTIRSDGFYQGKVRGKRGLVPSNFIEEISMAGSHHSKKKYSQRKSHRNAAGDTRGRRDGDRGGSREHRRIPTNTGHTASKSREDHKRRGSSRS